MDQLSLPTVETGSQGKKVLTPAREKLMSHFSFRFTYEKITLDQLDQLLQVYCKKFRFQLERGEKSGQLHWQGCFMPLNRKRCEAVRDYFSDFGFAWPKIDYLEPTRKEEAAEAYTMKEDTRVEGPWEKGFPAPPRIDKRLAGFKPREGWQQFVVDLLDKEPDDRTVYWHTDPIGGTGKSLLSKWLAQRPDVCVVSSCKSADIATVVHAAMLVLIIDIPRCNDGQYVPYNIIEQVKNGFVSDGKLKKKMEITSFAPPHVIVFSNFEPDRSKLSEDRWVNF